MHARVWIFLDIAFEHLVEGFVEVVDLQLGLGLLCIGCRIDSLVGLPGLLDDLDVINDGSIRQIVQDILLLGQQSLNLNLVVEGLLLNLDAVERKEEENDLQKEIRVDVVTEEGRVVLVKVLVVPDVEHHRDTVR